MSWHRQSLTAGGWSFIMKTPTETEKFSTDSNSAVKVWLVDDNARFRELVADILNSMSGIQCVRHFSSPTALLSTLASKTGPDVILLDVQMGNENGLDAVRPIKSLARTTRVLMFTTCFDSELRERALSDGASDYLIKGGSLDKLAECIRRPDDPAKICSSSRRRSARIQQATTATDATEIGTGSVSPHPLTRGLNFIRALWN